MASRKSNYRLSATASKRSSALAGLSVGSRPTLIVRLKVPKQLCQQNHGFVEITDEPYEPGHQSRDISEAERFWTPIDRKAIQAKVNADIRQSAKEFDTRAECFERVMRDTGGAHHREALEIARSAEKLKARVDNLTRQIENEEGLSGIVGPDGM